MLTHDTARNEYLLRLSLCPDLTDAQKLPLTALNTKPQRTRLDNINRQRLNAAKAWLEQDHHHIIGYHDPAYPEPLRHIDHPPPLLYINGDATVLSQPHLGYVGCRNPSRSGLELAYQLSYQTSQLGWISTSGLAMGIDGRAHVAALDAGCTTIAVLGCGIDRCYPKCHQELQQRIAKAGAVITEFPWGSAPQRHHFPLRNRIISGLSVGIVVIEASLRSGSLITARYALEQNREVFAVPGSPKHALSKGCHFLIKQGAKLVESVEDIVVELPSMLT